MIFSTDNVRKNVIKNAYETKAIFSLKTDILHIETSKFYFVYD